MDKRAGKEALEEMLRWVRPRNANFLFPEITFNSPVWRHWGSYCGSIAFSHLSYNVRKLCFRGNNVGIIPDGRILASVKIAIS